MHSEEKNQTEHEVDHRFDSLARNMADIAGVPGSQFLHHLPRQNLLPLQAL
jgi:hypothetical protein